MKKNLFVIAIIFLFCAEIFSQELTARQVMTNAVNKGSAKESVTYLKTQAEKITNQSEKRAVYIFLASVQEQLSLYEDAQKSYVVAAGISAASAPGMSKKSNEQLVLDAVRCCLCYGDYSSADKYLNSSVRNSKNEQVQMYVKLYSQWSALSKAESTDDLQEPVEVLKAYLKIKSMKDLHPVILLTLWYVTGDSSYSKQILSDFPNTTESFIVKGDVQLLPVPFWFFVPKIGEVEVGTGTYSDALEKSNSAVSSESSSESSKKFTKWQLGLFAVESYATNLAKEVHDKGFDSYIKTEKRASGTTYFIVIVNEDKQGNVADRLRSAGYDCYPVE